MAAVRNAAIGLLRLLGWTNLAAALRHYSCLPDQLFSILGIF